MSFYKNITDTPLYKKACTILRSYVDEFAYQIVVTVDRPPLEMEYYENDKNDIRGVIVYNVNEDSRDDIIYKIYEALSQGYEFISARESYVSYMLRETTKAADKIAKNSYYGSANYVVTGSNVASLFTDEK